MNKKCTRCKRVKSLKSYHNDKAARDGKCTMCKPCRLKAVAQSRETRKGKRNFITAFDIKTELVNFKQNLVVELNKSHQHTREYVDSSVRLEKLRRESEIKDLKGKFYSAPSISLIYGFIGAFVGVGLANLLTVIF